MDENLRLRIASYHPSPEAVKKLRHVKMTLLVAPSGVGKDSLKTSLLKSGHYHDIISHTTRKPRLNKGVMEKNDVNYHYISIPEAIRMLDYQEFIEAKVYANHLYGTSVAEIDRALKDDKTALNDVEVQGVIEYKTMDPAITAIFLLPPSFEVWLERLHRRGDLTTASIRPRLKAALTELGEFLRTDYYIGLINGDLTEATKQVGLIEENPAKYQPTIDLSRHAERLINNIEGYLDTAD